MGSSWSKAEQLQITLVKSGFIGVIVNVYSQNKQHILYDILATHTSLDLIEITFSIQYLFPLFRDPEQDHQQHAGMKHVYTEDNDDLADKVSAIIIEVKSITTIHIYEELIKNSTKIREQIDIIMKQSGGRKTHRRQHKKLQG